MNLLEKYPKTLIIAEIGINHNRSLAMACKLCDVAKECGADVIKTQLEKPTEHTLTWEETKELYEYCVLIGMPFACTAFDILSLNFLLENTKMEFCKIGSADSFNSSLITACLRSGLPVIQSSKLCGLRAYFSNCDTYHLHVVSEYPTPLEHCNIKRVSEPWCSGLSDHSGNPLIPALAVALGARIIECHLTLDNSLPGPDHMASLDPDGFREMVDNVRMAERAMRAR